ncbi:MAG: SdrD B-like domain-containing protein [Isosphaeraceae bacterium]|nr:SdrD B-like domain-containing protein [Isosphaeraceae bacterium]
MKIPASRRSSRASRLRKFRPIFDRCEPRQLLTGYKGVVQGTAFIDSNFNAQLDDADTYLSGMSVELYLQGNPTALFTTTTDSFGGYEFSNLDPGTYLVKQLGGNGYIPTASQAKSQLNPASSINADTIQVTIVDPNAVWVKYSGFSTVYEVVTDNAFGVDEINTVGQMRVSLGTAAGLSNLSAQYITYCGDIFHAVSFGGGENFQVKPGALTTMFDGTTNLDPVRAGRIGYLYNRYAPTSTTNIAAGALQLAIWETLYDTVADFDSGNFKVTGPYAPFTTAADVVALKSTALAMMASSVGKSEKAIFLDATLGGQSVPLSGRQGMFATGSLNFANGPAAKLSGFVYVDADDDGQKESGETPLGGIELVLTGTNDLGSITLSTFTKPDGSYEFANLRPGTYTVTEPTQPAGYFDGLEAKAGVVVAGTRGTDVVSSITLAAGDNVPNNNFGELPPAQLSGFVYVDADDDGVKETGETPLAAVALTLTGTDYLGAVVTRNTTTDSLGFYEFTNLAPGTYTVTETQPAGYFDGLEAKAGVVVAGTRGTDVVSSITLAAGDNVPNNNFGELPPAQLSGYVFVDKSNDGIFDVNESPIAGVEIKLTGVDYLGSIVSKTTGTDSFGFYEFTNLAPGTYTVTETQPAGYVDGLDALEGVVIFGSNTSDVLAGITLVAGASSEENDFGELELARLSGFVYVDADNDGTFDSGETPLSGVEIKLTGTDYLGTAVTKTVFTGSDGSYAFEDLNPGTYSVSEPTQPTGYFDGLDAKIGAVITGSNTTDAIATIVLQSGDSAEQNNFGELLPAKLSGFVYVDADDNGIKATTETGLPNVVITLNGTNDLGQPVSLSKQTDSTGFYEFAGLRPGTYTVDQPTQPTGYVDGLDSKGGVVILISNTQDTIPNIGLPSGANLINNNFGELLPKVGEISGRKYRDLTGNGLTSDDTALGGVTIQLFLDRNNSGTLDAADGAAIRSMPTGSDGRYAFTGLAAGRYFVSEVVASGWIRTAPALSSTYSIVVSGGSSSSGNDFANFELVCTDCSVTNISYLVNGSATYTSLRGNTNQGDVVTVTFTTTKPVLLSFVTYTAPSNTFVASEASRQEVFDAVTQYYATPGTYSMTVQNPNGNYQIDFVCGPVIDRFGPAGSNIFYTPQQRLIHADNDGSQPALAPSSYASIAGTVFVDTDSDGNIDSGENGLGGVTIKLTGVDDLGKSVSLTRVTAANGTYSFKGLRPGTYKVTETQPAGYTTTKNSVGTVGGVKKGSLATSTTDAIDAVILALGNQGIDYNFGEIASSGLVRGTTATIGYWQNPNGQELINKLNGGSHAKNLGNWLASQFPNLYGPSAGSNNLTGKTNAQVASYYKNLFNSGKKTECQVLSAALAVYVTDSDLAGQVAQAYGFIVSSTGTGARTFNVGSNGSNLGLSNNSTHTVLSLLKTVDAGSKCGKLWNDNSSKKKTTNNVFTCINEKGDIY